MWNDQFEVFAQPYQVLRYDLRGFGQSALPTTEPYSHSDDLKALMTYLGIESAYILGLSLGGAVAVDFVVTYPEAADAFSPVDAALIGGYEWLEGRPSAGLREHAQQSGLETAKTFWLNQPHIQAAREHPPVAARLAQIDETYSGWHMLTDDPVRIPEPPAIERLGTLSMSTLVIIGERDLLDFRCAADIMTERIAGAKKVVMLGVGHMSNMEDPERFNKIVLGFLAELQAFGAQ
jgi:pimeloyl-ACP methyl ester carboxylesterase